LPPELWTRIDEPLSLASLDRAAVTSVAQGMVAGVARLARAEHGVALEVDPSVYDALIAAGGHDPLLGARPMRRVIGRLLEGPLASLLLSGRLARGACVLARGVGDRLELEPAGPRADAAE
jgi:ATP-dependent Clp protease ATP-binding subunit ClpA